MPGFGETQLWVCLPARRPVALFYQKSPFLCAKGDDKHRPRDAEVWHVELSTSVHTTPLHPGSFPGSPGFIPQSSILGACTQLLGP